MIVGKIADNGFYGILYGAKYIGICNDTVV